MLPIKRTWLEKIRGEMTHQEVADMAGIDRSFYTQIENGTRSPSVETAKKIASALQFEWTLFFEIPCGETQLATGTEGE